MRRCPLITTALLGLLLGDGHGAFVAPAFRRARASPSPAIVRMCSTPPPADTLSVKDLKAALDELGVTWRGVAFDKEELSRLLVEARNRPPPPPAPAATDDATVVDEAEQQQQQQREPNTPATPSSDEDDTQGSGSDAAATQQYEEAYAAAYAEAMTMKVKELRGALAARNVGWADLYEKEEIAARLANLMARAALFSASGAIEPGKVAQLDGAQARAEMNDGRTPLIVDVFATWCGPCKLIAPMLDGVATKAGERCRVCKVDSDLEAALSSELRVAGLPTILFFRDGQEVHRLEGVPPGAGALDALVKEHLGLEL